MLVIASKSVVVNGSHLCVHILIAVKSNFVDENKRKFKDIITKSDMFVKIISKTLVLFSGQSHFHLCIVRQRSYDFKT